MASSNRKKQGGSKNFLAINPSAAGIDIGSKFHVVAVPADRDAEPVRTFNSFTGDLHRLADWLVACRIDTAAMESTGIYWVPLFEILEAHGIDVVLSNARDVKHVPGRKTDVNDAQWLHVVSDITGKTGMRIIRAILSGERDPSLLAKFRDVRCKASVEMITKALEGNFRPEHLLSLDQSVALYDTYQKHAIECDRRIEEILKNLHRADLSEDSLPAPRYKMPRQPNRLRFDVRSALYTMLGVDLTQIHGIGPYLAVKLVSECGTDMSKWPTAKHFTSWLCLTPANKISGGKVLSSHTRRSKNRITALLRLAAANVGKTDSALGAFYRRLSTRIGKSKAVDSNCTESGDTVLQHTEIRSGL